MQLDLSKHCIETEIRRLYNRSVSRYLKKKAEDPRLEADIELLKAALEELDFPRLRSAFAELAGGQDNRVVELTAGGDGGVVIRIDDQEIY